LSFQKLLNLTLNKTIFFAFFQSEFGEDDLEELVKVGLVYEVNNGHKFSHQTYGEFGFNKFLDRNFDDEDCAKFIVEVVLVDPSYRIIRAFLNFWILEKLDQKTFEIYRKKMLSSSVGPKEETPLHVAGQEGNENIFWFLYSALASKTREFENKKKEIEEYLLEKAKSDYNYIAFVNYFKNFEDKFDILVELKNNFGIDFIKRIFTIEMGGEKFLSLIAKWDRNALKVLKFLRETFSEDLKILREVFLSSGGYVGRSFLDVAFENLKNETLSSLLDELSEWKKMSFFYELILLRSGLFGVFLSNYAESRHFDNDFFSSFLDKLKLLLDEETLKAFFLAVGWGSFTLLHDFCLCAKNFNLLGTLEWINREIGKDFLLELILKRDKYENRTIFHAFTKSENRQSNSGTKLLKILKFFKENLKFENEFLLKEILFSVDQECRNVFLNIFSTNQGKSEASYKKNVLIFFDFLVNDLNLTAESLKKKLTGFEFLLFWTAQIERKSSRDRLVELIEGKFKKSLSDFYSAEILHKICENYSVKATKKILKYFDFVEEKNDFEFLKNYISGKNSEGQTILVHFHHSYFILFQVFKWLEKKFKNDKNFLENFLMQVDENGDSFLHVVLRKCDESKINNVSVRTFKFLTEIFDKSFVQNFLLIQNKRLENCLNLVCQRQGKKISGILKLLSKDFQNDREFFRKLLNDELKKNKKVRKWIEKNLNVEQTENN
jgi:hypothetical protein